MTGERRAWATMYVPPVAGEGYVFELGMEGDRHGAGRVQGVVVQMMV